MNCWFTWKRARIDIFEHGWASCLRILLFFECTACPCKFSSGQLRLSGGIVKVPRLQITLGFPKHAWNVGILVPQVFRSATKWCFRGVSCLAHNFLLYFLWQLLQRILPASRLVHNDGLDFCLPKFVSALRTSKSSPLHFAQVVNEYDDSPSSISLYL